MFSYLGNKDENVDNIVGLAGIATAGSVGPVSCPTSIASGANGAGGIVVNGGSSSRALLLLVEVGWRIHANTGGDEKLGELSNINVYVSLVHKYAKHVDWCDFIQC